MPEAKIPKDYDERVYAGLLGMSAGFRFGAPIEGWTHAQIEEHFGERRFCKQAVKIPEKRSAIDPQNTAE